MLVHIKTGMIVRRDRDKVSCASRKRTRRPGAIGSEGHAAPRSTERNVRQHLKHGPSSTRSYPTSVPDIAYQARRPIAELVPQNRTAAAIVRAPTLGKQAPHRSDHLGEAEVGPWGRDKVAPETECKVAEIKHVANPAQAAPVLEENLLSLGSDVVGRRQH
eukprot:372331-Rhodomonas_salina.1